MTAIVKTAFLVETIAVECTKGVRYAIKLLAWNLYGDRFCQYPSDYLGGRWVWKKQWWLRWLPVEKVCSLVLSLPLGTMLRPRILRTTSTNGASFELLLALLW